MKYNITGDNLQFVNIEFSPNETIYAEAGTMVYMSGNVKMESKAKGGIARGLKRMITGESFFITNFKATGGNGIVAFGGNIPGKIMPINVSEGNWLFQKDAFLCAEDTVDMDMAFQKKLSSAFFGGEGLILQRLSGKGTAFIHAAGDFTVIDLKPGQVYKISTSNVVGWQEGVSYEISSVGGIKTALFSGEGLFITTLTGPGKAVIQSLSLQDLALALYPYMPKQTSGN
ncbi:MAG: hypothetical protein PWQ88_1140 [Candidatus Methanomethylophilaceae archaeon]|nr:hypothetical protein [Candidatus Methanomethylophilaceae archaeon]MDI3542345.1 hypothetical protein [Candidatus Methanomethylophilaceae archaeon]HIJ00312.1 TIGR00266 family protein [Candidatus Methanomethylophilaceae archaeon]